jgi:2-polyprenyl-6-hydroxyphenyl methylase / 3-demethylubiquinone-9 3-methyltransferase
MPKTDRTDASVPSIDPDEVAKFAAMAAEWWDPDGPMRPLHLFNPVRLRFIRAALERHFAEAPGAAKPFAGLRIIDIGCGGGLVCEPMARLGAAVTGLDAAADGIRAARQHAEDGGLVIDYRHGTVEALVAAGEAPFDVVLSLEVVEHVAHPETFLADAAKLVRPGGLMLVATLNRTAKAFATAVVGAEYVLRWLPRGTHDWSKFIVPETVERALSGAGLVTEAPKGFNYNPLTRRWSVSDDTRVNYIVVAARPPA